MKRVYHWPYVHNVTSARNTVVSILRGDSV